MLVNMLKAKLHGVTVTDVQIDYEGSLTMDRALMDAVKIRPYEKIMVANLANGYRFETYAIESEPDSGTVCLNGAAAHKGKKGDKLIVFTFCALAPEELPRHTPLILHVDEQNRPQGGLKRM
ncbi:MAG: aspartate 1-decarboxylase [Kiritimatiellia bacterium]